MVISWILNSLSKDITDSVCIKKLQKKFGKIYQPDLANTMVHNFINFKRILVIQSNKQIILLLLLYKGKEDMR